MSILLNIYYMGFLIFWIFRGLSSAFFKNYHQPPHPLRWNGHKMQLFAKL